MALVPYSRPIRAVLAVAFSPDGRTLATGSFDGTSRPWDVATRRLAGGALAGDVGLVNSVAFSPDGAILATGGQDGTVRLWDVANHQLIGSPLSGQAGGVQAVAFSAERVALSRPPSGPAVPCPDRHISECAPEVGAGEDRCEGRLRRYLVAQPRRPGTLTTYH